jgi:hypothetical protein
MEHAHTKRYQDCLDLFIKYGGKNLSRIVREMEQAEMETPSQAQKARMNYFVSIRANSWLKQF